MIVIDPLENVKLLSDRHESYLMLREGMQLKSKIYQLISSTL